VLDPNVLRTAPETVKDAIRTKRFGSPETVDHSVGDVASGDLRPGKPGGGAIQILVTSSCDQRLCVAALSPKQLRQPAIAEPGSPSINVSGV